MGERIEMTDEERRALFGALPLSNDYTVDFTPEYFDSVPVRFRPVFKLKPMSKGAREKQKFALRQASAAIEKDSDTCADADAVMLESLRAHIVGWSNLINISDGLFIEFEQAADGGAKSIEILPHTLLMDLLEELSRISGLSRRLALSLT